MIIGLDARPMQSGERTGVGNYIYHLWKGLLQRGHRLILFSDRADAVAGEKAESSTTVVIRPGSNRYYWEQRVLPQLLQQHPVDIYHATWNYGIPIRYRGATVTTIHDLIPLVMPELYRGKSLNERLEYLLYRFFLGQTIRRTDQILTVSKTSQQDIADRFPNSTSKTSYAYEGYDLVPSPSPSFDSELLKKFGISGMYLTYLGGFEKRKAVETLLTAFPMIRSKMKIQLVLIGKKNKYFRRFLTPWQGPDIVFTDYLPNIAMQTVLRHSTVLVYPTRYEGFGLPMVEAMACGIPVIARNVSTMREIGTGAALLLDVFNPSTLAAACNTLLTNPALREHYRLQGLQRAQQFHWANTVIATEQAYHRAYTTRHPIHE